jgi:hypothetical protein
MNSDVEQLVREGLDRLAAATPAPAGLVARARRRCFRQRLAVGSALAGGTAAVAALAVIAATGAAGVATPPGSAAIHARTAAYVLLQHVERAVAGQRNQVMDGQSVSVGTGSNQKTRSVTWSYRGASRFEEYNFNGKPYLDTGTAEIHGRLLGVYVAYYNRTWSGGRKAWQATPGACTKTARLEMGGPPPATQAWPDFIGTMLGCGDASVTGRTWINGVHTIVITGMPVGTRLPKGMVQATEAGIHFTLYVDPATYLPVRAIGSTTSYGGGAKAYTYSTVTNIQWRPATAANVAQAVVTIPRGFRHV